jgi:hypothetical protein
MELQSHPQPASPPHARPRSRPPIGLRRPTFAGSTRRSGGRWNSASLRTGGDLAHRPLLVIAGAGSGKTLTLAAGSPGWCSPAPTRADPALTFSRRAARRWSGGSAGS